MDNTNVQPVLQFIQLLSYWSGVTPEINSAHNNNVIIEIYGPFCSKKKWVPSSAKSRVGCIR